MKDLSQKTIKTETDNFHKGPFLDIDSEKNSCDPAFFEFVRL